MPDQTKSSKEINGDGGQNSLVRMPLLRKPTRQTGTREKLGQPWTYLVESRPGQKRLDFWTLYTSRGIENQALEEPGNTRGKRDQAKGDRRAGRSARPVYENDGDRPLETLSFNPIFPLFTSEMARLLIASYHYHILLLDFIGVL